MKSNLSRRELVNHLLVGAVALPAAGALAANTAPPAAPVLLDPADPTAKALGFVRDSTKVDTKANPTYKPGQMCGTCAQFGGKAGDAQGNCNIFPGRQVPSKGWCRVYAAKPVANPAAAAPVGAKPAPAKPAPASK